MNHESSAVTIGADSRHKNEPPQKLGLILQDETPLSELKSTMMSKMRRSPTNSPHMLNDAEKGQSFRKKSPRPPSLSPISVTSKEMTIPNEEPRITEAGEDDEETKRTKNNI